MSLAIKQSSKSSVKPRLIELINNMSEAQCKKLFGQLEVWKEEDRRKHPRKACSVPVDFAVRDQALKGFIKDISLGGVFIEAHQNLVVGEEITLTFSSPHQQEPIKIVGEVVRKNFLGIGVKFKKAFQDFGGSTWIDCRRKIEEVSEERRIDPRVEFKCPVIIEGVPREQIITDISLGGVFVECESALRRRFQLGQTINLSMRLPNENGLTKTKAKVVNLAERGIGCKFTGLDRRSADAIQRCFSVVKYTLPIL